MILKIALTLYLVIWAVIGIVGLRTRDERWIGAFYYYAMAGAFVSALAIIWTQL